MPSRKWKFVDVSPRSDSGRMDAIYDRFRAADDPMSLRKQSFVERHELFWRGKALDWQSYVQHFKLDCNSAIDIGLLHLKKIFTLILLHLLMVRKKTRFWTHSNNRLMLSWRFWSQAAQLLKKTVIALKQLMTKSTKRKLFSTKEEM